MPASLPLMTMAAVLALSLAGFVLGHRRALALGGGSRKPLHSLPTYHGLYVALWTLLPPLIALALFSALEGPAIAAIVTAGLPESVTQDRDLALAMAKIRSIAGGDDVIGNPGEALLAAAERFAAFDRWADRMIVLVMAALSAVGFFLAWQRLRGSTRTFGDGSDPVMPGAGDDTVRDFGGSDRIGLHNDDGLNLFYDASTVVGSEGTDTDRLTMLEVEAATELDIRWVDHHQTGYQDDLSITLASGNGAVIIDQARDPVTLSQKKSDYSPQSSEYELFVPGATIDLGSEELILAGGPSWVLPKSPTLVGSDAGEVLLGGATAETLDGGAGDDLFLIAHDATIDQTGGGADVVQVQDTYEDGLGVSQFAIQRFGTNLHDLRVWSNDPSQPDLISSASSTAIAPMKSRRCASSPARTSTAAFRNAFS